MEISEQKPTLKIGKGEVVNMKLESLNPFKEGENEWDGVKKKWFGYNVTKGSQEFTYFASEAVHKLIQIAKPEGEFQMELRTVNNKEGQSRSMWFLNGKNLWQYEDDLKPDTMEVAPQKEVEINPTPVSNPGPGLPDDQWKIDIEERLEKLEKALYSKTVKTDDDIPF